MLFSTHFVHIGYVFKQYGCIETFAACVPQDKAVAIDSIAIRPRCCGPILISPPIIIDPPIRPPIIIDPILPQPVANT